MTSCCSCSEAKLGCKNQWIYFIVALMLWGYALATLLIPADFPIQLGSIKDMFIEPSLVVMVFTFGFVALNIMFGALANAKLNKALEAKPEDYLLTKLRNAFVAAFGFVALLRLVIFLVWMVGYTA